MTCIAGYRADPDNLYMGCDSFVGDTHTGFKLAGSKIKVFDNKLVIGGCGTVRGLNLMAKINIDEVADPFHYIENVADAFRKTMYDNNAAARKDNRDDSGCEFIVAWKNHLYTIGTDYCVYELRYSYASTGSGFRVALGSMYTSQERDETRVLTALRAASEFTTTVRGPYKVVHLLKDQVFITDFLG